MEETKDIRNMFIVMLVIGVLTGVLAVLPYIPDFLRINLAFMGIQ